MGRQSRAGDAATLSVRGDGVVRGWRWRERKRADSGRSGDEVVAEVVVEVKGGLDGRWTAWMWMPTLTEAEEASAPP